MVIATFVLLAVCLLVWFVFKHNYHTIVVKFFQRWKKIRKLCSENPVYCQTFKKDFWQGLKDTGKDKNFYLLFVLAPLFVLAIIFMVINFWVKPAGMITNLVNLGILICVGGAFINSFLCTIETIVNADEKGRKVIDDARKKNQQLLGGRRTATPATQPTPARPAAPAGAPVPPATPAAGAAGVAPQRRGLSSMRRGS